MKKLLAAGVASVALLGLSSVASAQQDCVNGWRMIKEQVPVRCDVLPSAFSGPGVPAAEPLITGSIAPAPIEEPLVEEPFPAEEPAVTGSIAVAPVQGSEMPPRPGAPESSTHAFAASRDECHPGQFWMMELNSGNRPVACE